MDNKTHIRKIRERLEKLAEIDTRTAEREIERVRKEDSQDKKTMDCIHLRHAHYLLGINEAYQIFCLEFNASYKPIKSKVTVF